MLTSIFKRKHKRPLTKRLFTQKRAKELQANTPQSELWFYKLYQSYQHPKDLFNKAHKGYIPDVINYQFRYIIEIDGSVHDTLRQQGRDRVKDNYFKRTGFKVFRIKAYDTFSFDQCIQQLIEFRNSK